VKLEQGKEKEKKKGKGKKKKKTKEKNENERGLERRIVISLSSPSKDVKL